MTQKSRDGVATEFSLWLRNYAPDNQTKLRYPDPIDSSLGFVTVNIDYMWQNYKTGNWMLIEEKRYSHDVKYYQRTLFKLINFCLKLIKKYHGFHIIQFEKTNPEDGKIFLDYKEITKEELLSFLQFKLILKSPF